MIFPSFCAGGYESQSWAADQERTVNWFPELMESPGASSKVVLYPWPGVTELRVSSTSPGRAHIAIKIAGLEREFAVEGNRLSEIFADATVTGRGTVATDGNPATISFNGDGGNQLFVTSGTNGYIFDLTANTLTQIAALNGLATMGGYLDGYFLLLNAATSTFYVSALLDGTSWLTGTMFAQRSAGSDPWVAMVQVGQFVWLLGQITSEVWYNTAASFPFGLHPSGRVPYGCAAPFSARNADGALVWLGQTDIGKAFVLRAPGFAPEVVSDYPRQHIFSGYAVTADAVADVINWEGHVTYVLTFPTQNITWGYDLRSGAWFQIGTWISEQNEYAAWRPQWHVIAFGEHRILDSATGSFYRLDPQSRTDVDERPIRRLRRAPTLSNELERVYYSSFTLDVQPGVGTATGQGADPQMMMRMSSDGGQTWGMERWASVGKIGEYGKRVNWHRLGMARRRVFEVAFTDPCFCAIVGAYLELGNQQQAQG